MEYTGVGLVGQFWKSNCPARPTPKKQNCPVRPEFGKIVLLDRHDVGDILLDSVIVFTWDPKHIPFQKFAVL